MGFRRDAAEDRVPEVLSCRRFQSSSLARIRRVSEVLLNLRRFVGSRLALPIFHHHPLSSTENVSLEGSEKWVGDVVRSLGIGCFSPMSLYSQGNLDMLWIVASPAPKELGG